MSLRVDFSSYAPRVPQGLTYSDKELAQTFGIPYHPLEGCYLHVTRIASFREIFLSVFHLLPHVVHRTVEAEEPTKGGKYVPPARGHFCVPAASGSLCSDCPCLVEL
jgi:hypothetical protein